MEKRRGAVRGGLGGKGALCGGSYGAVPVGAGGGVRAEARVGWLIALPTRPRRLALPAERFGAWKHYKFLMKGVSEAGVYQASFPLPQLPLHRLAVKLTPLVPPCMWLAAPRRPRHTTKRPPPPPPSRGLRIG